MGWNYRIVRRYYDREEMYEYYLAEVYYDDDGKIEGWVGPVSPYGESVPELLACVNLMKGAVNRPVLEEMDGSSTLFEARNDVC